MMECTSTDIELVFSQLFLFLYYIITLEIEATENRIVDPSGHREGKDV